MRALHKDRFHLIRVISLPAAEMESVYQRLNVKVTGLLLYTVEHHLEEKPPYGPYITLHELHVVQRGDWGIFPLNSPFLGAPLEVLPVLASPSFVCQPLTRRSWGPTPGQQRCRRRPLPRHPRRRSTTRGARGQGARPPRRHSDGKAL